METLFITGTGTGVGKTVASAWLCRELSNAGHRVGYVKPVQTGGTPAGDELLSADLEYVKKSAPKLSKTLCCQNFRIPASPHLVAAQEGRKIILDELLAKIADFANDLDFLIVEGAGGISVPLNDQDEMVDMCRELKAKAICVTSTALGTLNHSKLTIEYLKNKGCEDNYFIMMRPETELEIIEEDNIARLAKMAKPLALLPFMSNLDTEGEAPLAKSFVADKIYNEIKAWI